MILFTRLRGLLASRGTPLLATTALCAIAAVLATWPLALNLGGATLGTGEVLLTAWQLNWFHQALLTDPMAWADANIFFPYGSTASLNDLLLTHALVTLPAAWAASPVLALNLALLGGIVLCGVFAHLLIVELTDAPGAAMVGGVLFALTPFRFLHLGHLSIAAAWAIPLFFWALLRHLRQPSWVRAALVAACGVAVGASSLYHAAYVAPIVPLVLLFGARRGPGGREVWLPLLVAGLPGLALLASLLAPYATALRSFGVAAAPADLLRYGADLSSLGQKPSFLGGASGGAGINPEARLYPGAGLALLATGGIVLAAWSLRSLRGWRRHVALALLVIAGFSGLGLLLPLPGPLGKAWGAAVLTLIWGGPVCAMAWAIGTTGRREATGPAVAIRLGVAGAALSFVLALGPEARYMTEAIGAAPYSLLTRATTAFEGTRAPARFGGIVVLFLGLVAAGAIAALARGIAARRRLAAVVLSGVALAACFAELPAPELPEGRGLVPLPDLHDDAYTWIRDRPGRFGILELPDWGTGGGEDYEYRSWRSLRYMLASKQHRRHLANGTGRIDPFLWRRFRGLEPWSDDSFAFIAAYFPVAYVLVHEAGIPAPSKDAVWARLERRTDGWEEVFRSAGARVYTIDRSFGRGTFVDRLFLRRETAPRVNVAFSARVAPGGPRTGGGAPPSGTLELLREGDPVGSWEIHGEWRRCQVSVPVEATPSAGHDGWPRPGVLFRWRLRGEEGPGFELRSLSVGRGVEPLD